MYKYLQLGKIRWIEKSLLLPKTGGFKKSLLLLKIRRICEILALTKNQADLQNPCVYRKSGGR
jgi:hypothetical protein